METTQTCICCGEVKPLSEYYKHRMMANGHLGRCKACHRAAMRGLRASNPEKYRSYDRERSKLPSRKLAHSKRIKARRARDKASTKAYKMVSRGILSGKLQRPDHCQRCMVSCIPQAHHDDYGKPLDVMWLCPVCHAGRHLELGRLRTVDAPLIRNTPRPWSVNSP
jgi:hypothetical protein